MEQLYENRIKKLIFLIFRLSVAMTNTVIKDKSSSALAYSVKDIHRHY